MLDRDKHSSFLGPLKRYEEHACSVVSILLGVIITSLYFLSTLRMSTINSSVTLHLAGKACQGQTP
jgi:hypothetical protein